MRKFPNRQILELSSREAARAYNVDANTLLCRVLADLKLFVPSQDVTMTPHLALDGFWESWITMYIQSIVRPGWKVVNVGAAFGYYTIFCAAHGAHVAAFEPQQELADLIKNSAMVNGFDQQVKVLNQACGKEDATLDLFVDAGRVGGATLQTRNMLDDPYLPNSNKTRKIQVGRLDDAGLGVWYVGAVVSPIDLFIIDTEGHEPEVLEGAEELLRACPRAILIIEVTPSWYQKPAEFVAMLDQRWQLREIRADGTLGPLTPSQLLTTSQSTIALLPK